VDLELGKAQAAADTLPNISCLLCGACFLLSAVCYLLSAVCYLPSSVCCLLFAVCCVLDGADHGTGDGTK
jgi:hypothetical protein